MESLENDDFMRHQLGALFIERFLYLKKDFEIQRLKKNSVSEENPDNDTERLYKEDRAVYFLSLWVYLNTTNYSVYSVTA